MLDDIKSPEVLGTLTDEELDALAQEIRDRIIQTSLSNGGHMASNLGVVELTLALHRCFNSPRDAIIFDVGHQCYAHKLLTGRACNFHTLRMLGGISGFPKRNESPHDCFNTGHSSTALSLALGLCRAYRSEGTDRRVVVVVGDGAMTGGVFMEALNDAGHHADPLIVVLNDNEMSISPNVGALSRYLGRLRVNRRYRRLKVRVVDVMRKGGRLGRSFKEWTEKVKNTVKYLLLPTILFEEYGFTYLGPVDGHDRKGVEAVLNLAKTVQNRPVLVHVVTRKGCGYRLAEENPVKYHGVAPFIVERQNSKPHPSFSQVFGECLVVCAKANDHIVAITAAMREGTGLMSFSTAYPDRFYDVGIAEQHAVALAAGMASGGLKPVVAIYGSFLQRAFDQLLMDVCINHLAVVFAIDRGGLVGQDGETHHGIYDLGYLRQMPELVVMAPAVVGDMEGMLNFAMTLDVPCALHYGKEAALLPYKMNDPVELGKVLPLRQGKDGVVLAIGSILENAHLAVELLEEKGIYLSLIQARFLWPLDEAWLNEISGPLWVVEENILKGGFGSEILEWCEANRCGQPVHLIGIREPFIPQGTIDEQRVLTGLDPESIAGQILKGMKQRGG